MIKENRDATYGKDTNLSFSLFSADIAIVNIDGQEQQVKKLKAG